MAKQLQPMSDIDKLMVITQNLAIALQSNNERHDKTDEILLDYGKRIVYIETHMTLDSRKQQNILAHGKRHITKILGGTNSPRYKTDYRKTIQWMWSDYRNFFGVVSYKDTAAADYDRAIEWIDAWRPLSLAGLSEPDDAA